MLKDKKITAIFLVFLMLLGAIVPASETFAQDTHELKKVRINRMELKGQNGDVVNLNGDIQEQKNCRLEIDWDASEYGTNIKEGDYFNVNLPKDFKASESSFAIYTTNGNKVANAKVNKINFNSEGDTLKVVFTNLAKDNANVRGSIAIKGNVQHGYVLSKNKIDIKNVKEKTLSPDNPMETQTAKLTINWKGDGAGTATEVNNRPKTIAIKLYSSSDDGKTWQEYEEGRATVEAGKDTTTVYEWKDLPAKNEDDKALIYKAEVVTKSNYHTPDTPEPEYTKDKDGNVTHSEFVVNNVYNDNWNYKINLEWNSSDPVERYDINKVTTSKDKIKQQCVLTISNQKVYKAGELEVRLPRELFDARPYSGNWGGSC